MERMMEEKIHKGHSGAIYIHLKEVEYNWNYQKKVFLKNWNLSSWSTLPTWHWVLSFKDFGGHHYVLSLGISPREVQKEVTKHVDYHLTQTNSLMRNSSWEGVSHKFIWKLKNMTWCAKIFLVFLFSLFLTLIKRWNSWEFCLSLENIQLL